MASTETDIAIVGIAVRVPGANDYRAFWRNLRDGVESIRQYSEEELLAAGEDPAQLRRQNYVRSGAPLDRMELFDGEFFGFSPKESAILDPQHRHFLESAWEALEDSGHPPETFKGPIGVFAGCGMGSYFYFNLCTNPDLVANVGMFLLRHTGNDKDFLATRASYLFNLTGPSINVQTACSTSLVAVHLACQSLLSGECEMALAGGVTIELPHRRGYLFRENEILSPDGHCHAFDHRAQGTVFGSGVGVVALRPLAKALADGDHIHAVIRGSAINNDGASKAGYLAPSVDGQASAVVEAMALAGVDADTIDYVECHGTGTYLGDPIEVAALTQAFRQSTDKTGFCRIGSVKSNIGHTDAAAGVIGLIKTALALEIGQMPPTINFEAPNPSIDFAGSPFLVNDRLTEWPRPGDRPRRAAVNSLGVGGTNAHVVLEEPPARRAATTPIAKTGPTGDGAQKNYQLITLSARSRAALDQAGARLAAHLEEHPDQPLADVAYSLKVGRRAFSKRRVFACQDRDEAIAILRGKDEGRVFTHGALEGAPSVYFMFPGGGAQYPQMARDLYQSEPFFRQLVDQGLRCLAGKIDYDLRDVLFPEPERMAWAAQRFQKPSVQLPAIFIVEYALARLLMSRGIVPRGLIGHSLGENTAACLAEVFTFEEGIGLVHLRGSLFDGVAPGGMLSVPLPSEQLRPLLTGELDLACINSPGLCVVSGPNQALAAFAQELLKRDVQAQRIGIDIAAHSRMLEGILAPFGAYLRGLKLRPPKIPFPSNRTGTWITAEMATDPDYWVQHLRHTVNFGAGIRTLADDKSAVLLEVGPGKTLGSLSKQNPAVNAQAVVSTLRHADEKVDDRAFFQTVLGRLWALGVDLPAEVLWPDLTRRRVSLPTYPFQGQHYWIDAGKTETARPAAGFPSKLEDFEQWFFAPVWRRNDPDRGAPAPRSSWLIFLDETGVGTALVERLRARGDEVVTVQAGDAFYKVDDRAYWLSPEHGSDGYQALVRDILASGRAPNRIVHLWLLSDGETFRPGSSFFHRNQERGFYSLLFLAQALGGQDYPGPLHLTVVTAGAQKVGDEPLVHADQATVLGPCKVIPRELPGVTCATVDLPAPQRLPALTIGGALHRLRAAAGKTNGVSPDRQVDDLLAELLLPAENAVVALRPEQQSRWVERYERIAVPEVGGSAPLRTRGVYLITGGLGGIGLTVARMLAREYQARLVLLSRAPLPAREDWQAWLSKRPTDSTLPILGRIRAVQQLEAAGAEVLVCAGDVADADRMAEVVAETKQRFGALSGVFHAAGVIEDGLIAGKRQSSVEAVFGPKVHGTLVLDRVLRHEPIDFLLLFSSTSAAIAPAGQVDYVAVNAFLNSYARKARAEGRPVTAIGWGVWNEVGMAASTAEKMGLNSAEASESPARYPLFETKQVQPRRGGMLRGKLMARRDWMLDEHRTAQHRAILPGTGYLELARAALRETGETGPFEIEDLFFFRALEAPDTKPVDLRVRLKPTDEGYQYELQTRQSAADGSEGWLLHAQANLRLGSSPRQTHIDVDAIAARCDARRTTEDVSGIRSPQEEHLAFGPRWRVLRQASFGRGEALGRLTLPERYRGDLDTFGLHPALLDMATGFALELAPGYGRGGDLWVPLSYKRVRVHADLVDEVCSWVRVVPAGGQSGFVAFDVVIADRNGQVLIEVEHFTMRRLSESDLGATHALTAAELERSGPARQRELSPAELAFQHGLSQGITPGEGLRALKRVLAQPHRDQVIVSSMDVRALYDQAGALAARQETAETKFSRPQLESDYVAPRNEIEKTLVGFWESLLGVNQIGVRDSFFDLGGHSLIAVRLFAKITKTYNVDYPISVLFEAPTVEACARLLAQTLGETPALAADAADAVGDATAASGQPTAHKTRYTHLVPMHPPNVDAGRKLPFFLAAGMFGNVLNLRHLAGLVGSDRPFYGLQARGLYGDHKPHHTFEEMARDYIAELQTVQPHGPYLLGGFSGGGITAYEMARQLAAAGEEVPLIVMLDTPLPKDDPLTLRDKLAIHRQNLGKQGAGYAVNWLKARRDWRQHLQEREEKLRRQQDDGAAATNGHDFHSQVIEAAFYQAVADYQLASQPFHIALFRPKLRPAHHLGPGRAINTDRRRIYHDNGWAPFVSRVEVFEVPGDHDSMVLEPNVRVLAVRLRECLEAAQSQPTGSAPAGEGESGGSGEARGPRSRPPDLAVSP